MNNVIQLEQAGGALKRQVARQASDVPLIEYSAGKRACYSGARLRILPEARRYTLRQAARRWMEIHR